MKRWNGVCRVLLMLGMGLMIPCYLFTVGNVCLSPWPLYERSRLALVALTLLGAAGLLLAFREIARREAFLARHETAILVGAALFYVVVQMVMAHVLRYIPITDTEQCFTAAQLIVDNGTFRGVERPSTYFARCTNNLGFVYVLANIFRFFGLFGWTDRFMQLALVSSLLFTAGLLCGARVVRRIGGVRAQMRMFVLFASCLPLLYCTTEIYTDAFSVAFPMIIIECAFRIQEARNKKSAALFIALFALVSFVGAQMRFTAIIASVACLIVLLLQPGAVRGALAAAALAVVMLVGGAAVDMESDRHIDRDVREANSLPLLHYIAMGLPVQEDEGYGQYGWGRWFLFTTSFDDPAERDAALLDEVIDRVYYLRYPSRLLNMMSRKNLSTFGDGTFLLNEVIEGDEHAPDNAVKQVIFREGALYPAYYHLCTGLFMAQMLVACLACAQAIGKRDTRGAALFIALVGAFLLLCIWETRARYFFQFETLLLCAGALLDISGGCLKPRL